MCITPHQFLIGAHDLMYTCLYSVDNSSVHLQLFGLYRVGGVWEKGEIYLPVNLILILHVIDILLVECEKGTRKTLDQ